MNTPGTSAGPSIEVVGPGFLPFSCGATRVRFSDLAVGKLYCRVVSWGSVEVHGVLRVAEVVQGGGDGPMAVVQPVAGAAAEPCGDSFAILGEAMDDPCPKYLIFDAIASPGGV